MHHLTRSVLAGVLTITGALAAIPAVTKPADEAGDDTRVIARSSC